MVFLSRWGGIWSSCGEGALFEDGATAVMLGGFFIFAGLDFFLFLFLWRFNCVVGLSVSGHCGRGSFGCGQCLPFLANVASEEGVEIGSRRGRDNRWGRLGGRLHHCDQCWSSYCLPCLFELVLLSGFFFFSESSSCHCLFILLPFFSFFGMSRHTVM